MANLRYQNRNIPITYLIVPFTSPFPHLPNNIWWSPCIQWLGLSPCRLIHRSYVPSVLWLNHVKIVPLGFRLPRISIMSSPKKCFNRNKPQFYAIDPIIRLPHVSPIITVASWPFYGNNRVKPKCVLEKTSANVKQHGLWFTVIHSIMGILAMGI